MACSVISQSSLLNMGWSSMKCVAIALTWQPFIPFVFLILNLSWIQELPGACSRNSWTWDSVHIFIDSLTSGEWLIQLNPSVMAIVWIISESFNCAADFAGGNRLHDLVRLGSSLQLNLVMVVEQVVTVEVLWAVDLSRKRTKTRKKTKKRQPQKRYIACNAFEPGLLKDKTEFFV